MASVGEILSMVRESVRGRLRNPVIGSFIVAWSLCNWKVFYFTLFVSEGHLPQLFHGVRYPDRLTYVSRLLDTAGWKGHIIYPGLATLGFIIVAPMLGIGGAWMMDFWAQMQKEFDQKHFKKRLFSDTEMRDARDERDRERNKATALDAENSKLRKENSDLVVFAEQSRSELARLKSSMGDAARQSTVAREQTVAIQEWLLALRNDPAAIDALFRGRWKKRWKAHGDVRPGTEEFLVDGGTCHLLTGPNTGPFWTMRDLDVHVESSQVTFRMVSDRFPGQYYVVLRIESAQPANIKGFQVSIDSPEAKGERARVSSDCEVEYERLGRYPSSSDRTTPLPSSPPAPLPTPASEPPPDTSEGPTP